MQYIQQLEEYFKDEKFSIVAEEVDFFMNQYKGKNAIQDDLLNKITGRIFKMSLAGICLGVSLSLSLRRYVPSYFGHLTAFRMVTETCLVFGGYVQFSKFATYSGHNDLLPLRKGLILDNDKQYLQMLMRQYQQYPMVFLEPQDILKRLLTEDEIFEWTRKYNYNLDYLFQRSVY